MNSLFAIQVNGMRIWLRVLLVWAGSEKKLL